MIKMNARQLRSQSTVYSLQSTEKNDIYIILDNVLDTYNIGAIFRLADAVGAKRIYLCGGTETPPNPRIKKASINTMEVVEWEYCETAAEAIGKAREDYRLQTTDYSKKQKETVDGKQSLPFAGAKGRPSTVDLQVVAIEQNEKSIPYHKYEYKQPIAFVVGNESYGILAETLKKCDRVVELPMFGVNISLNVMVSLAIVLYRAIGYSKDNG